MDLSFLINPNYQAGAIIALIIWLSITMWRLNRLEAEVKK
jgi:hypothetical protein